MSSHLAASRTVLKRVSELVDAVDLRVSRVDQKSRSPCDPVTLTRSHLNRGTSMRPHAHVILRCITRSLPVLPFRVCISDAITCISTVSCSARITVVKVQLMLLRVTLARMPEGASPVALRSLWAMLFRKHAVQQINNLRSIGLSL